MINNIIKIVKQASQYMLTQQYEIHSKGNISNFVTTADLQVEDYLKHELMTLTPSYGFIGEEEDAKNTDQEFLWVVDPIDGTANFVREMKLSAISVGLVHNGEPVLGVIYNPFTDDLFYASEGNGAFWNGNPIHVSNRDFSHSVMCTAFSTYKKEYAPPCFRILQQVYDHCDDMRRLGSAAIELAYLAAGKCELYFEIRLFPWDYAAGLAILKEAGGYFGTIWDNDISFMHPSPIVAANSKESFDQLMSIVKKELPTRL